MLAANVLFQQQDQLQVQPGPTVTKVEFIDLPNVLVDGIQDGAIQTIDAVGGELILILFRAEQSWCGASTGERWRSACRSYCSSDVATRERRAITS